MMIFGGGVFRRSVSHEDGALMNWISALMRGDMRKMVSLHNVRIQKEDSHPEGRKSALTRT